ncbi:MAG: hypothetical protein IJA20_03685 [Methanocorpusculum sp.]|nr:hypothetical protein [Oscillospiraceae bacterium]MBQ3569759.1 hypothetical protein [Methanocorpusculum sp.]
MKRGCFSLITTLMLLLCFTTTAFAAGGRITVTYNNGGSINVLSAVKMEGNVIYVEDDTKVEIVAVPNDGYAVAGVYLNDQSMNISGAGPQTILVAPKGNSVTLRITFIKAENMGNYTQPDESTLPPAAEDNVSSSPAHPSPPSETTTEQPTAIPAQPATTPDPDTPDDTHPETPDVPAEPIAPGMSDELPPETEAPSVPPSILPYPHGNEQQEPSVISTEITNGGVGGLTAPQADTTISDRIVTAAVITGSLAVAAVITVIIIKKGSQR